MLLGSKFHTAGDTKKWTVNYARWLANTVDIESVTITSSSTTCTVGSSEVLGKDVIFFLTGGSVGETVTVSIAMTDSDTNVKHDTVIFTCVAP